MAPMRKEASPAVPSEVSEISANLTRLAGFSCSERGAEAQEEMKKRRYPKRTKGVTARSKPATLRQAPGDRERNSAYTLNPMSHSSLSSDTIKF